MEVALNLAIVFFTFVGGFMFGRAYQLHKEIERVEAIHRLHALGHHYYGIASEPQCSPPEELPGDSR